MRIRIDYRTQAFFKKTFFVVTFAISVHNVILVQNFQRFLCAFALISGGRRVCVLSHSP